MYSEHEQAWLIVGDFRTAITQSPYSLSLSRPRHESYFFLGVEIPMHAFFFPSLGTDLACMLPPPRHRTRADSSLSLGLLKDSSLLGT